MNVDRYLRVVLTVIAAALAVIAVRPWMPAPGRAQAQAQALVPRYEFVLPKAYGKLIGYSNGNLLLEDRDGHLRIIDVDGKPPEVPKIKALVRFQ